MILTIITVMFTFNYIIADIVIIFAINVSSKTLGMYTFISPFELQFAIVLRITYSDYATSLYKFSAPIYRYLPFLKYLFFSFLIILGRYVLYYLFSTKSPVLFMSWMSNTRTQTLPRPLSKRGGRNETICPEPISVNRCPTEI